MRLILMFLVMTTSIAYAQLPEPVLAALKAEHVAPENVSVFVQRVDEAQPLLSHQAGVSRNPASVMKLLTSYAALDLLGPSFRWKTQFYGLNYPKQGFLDGGLWIKGSGDPTMNTAALNEVAIELKQKYNLNEICCDVLLDQTAYANQSFNAADFDAKPYRAYNAPAEAVMLNQQAVRLQFSPSANGIVTVVYPQWKTLNKNIDVKLIDGDCGDWKNLIKIQREGQILSLQGDFPKSCGDKYIDINWLDGSDYFGNVLASIWEDVGGRWIKKSAFNIKVTTVPQNAVLLTEHLSQTLAEALREMNKSSNNVIARSMYLSLSRAGDETQVATTSKSEQVVKNWLKTKGLIFPELVLENGAGLSRVERINAEHVGALLVSAYHSAVMPELMASLPIYGVDGTLKSRKDSPLYGRAHLKTGSLDGVRTMAGYVLDAKGRRWVMVVLANGENVGATKPAQDALLTWIDQQK
jgi:D-alanyl-D-alanine carboxypeptidase/D-alanyl-D-alanine-endopeptidase (penicillin-binding protein 4)